MSLLRRLAEAVLWAVGSLVWAAATTVTPTIHHCEEADR